MHEKILGLEGREKDRAVNVRPCGNSFSHRKKEKKLTELMHKDRWRGRKSKMARSHDVEIRLSIELLLAVVMAAFVS